MKTATIVVLAATVSLGVARATEPAVGIGPKGEIQISQQGLPSLTLYPTFFAEGRFVAIKNPVMDQQGEELSAAQSMALPSGAEIPAKVTAEASEGGVAVGLGWGGGTFDGASAFLTLPVPQEIAQDITIAANGKPIMADGAVKGSLVAAFNSLEFTRSSDGKVLFEISGEMSGVDAFEPGKGSRTGECPDIRIRRKMSEAQELRLNIIFPEQP